MRETLSSLWTALWHVRRPGARKDIGALLPPLSPAGHLHRGDVDGIIRRVDRIVRVVVFWRSQRCFYRAFAGACALRRRGVPARLNFGLRLKGACRRRCHCWITIGDRPLAESGDPSLDYPVSLGQSNNDVYYWLADKGGNPLPPS